MRKLLVSAGAIGALAVAGVMQSGTPAQACSGSVAGSALFGPETDENPDIQQEGQVGFWVDGTINIATQSPADATDGSSPVVDDDTFGDLQGTRLLLSDKCGGPS